MNILEFKEKDIITRVESSKRVRSDYNENLGITIESETKHDSSYIGDPMEFIGVYNNQIWAKTLTVSGIPNILGNRTIRLNIDGWSDGWDMYTLPKGYRIEKD